LSELRFLTMKIRINLTGGCISLRFRSLERTRLGRGLQTYGYPHRKCSLVNFIRVKEESCRVAVRAMVASGLNMDEDRAFDVLLRMYFDVGIESDRAFFDFLSNQVFRHNALNNILLFCVIRCNYSRCFDGKECNKFR
jgi:hypothetical protein